MGANHASGSRSRWGSGAVRSLVSATSAFLLLLTGQELLPVEAQAAPAGGDGLASPVPERHGSDRRDTGTEPPSTHGAHPWAPHQVLVRFEPGVSASTRASVRRSAGGNLEKRLPVPRVELLTVQGPVQAAVRALEAHAVVTYAEPNFVYQVDSTPNDPGFGQLWGLHNTGQTVQGQAGTPDADIDAPEAWDTATGSSAVKVAVVDSGVAYDHPDLADNIWTNPGETLNGIDDDADGYVDDTRCWDFVDGDRNPYDYHGHGTHVAGIIGATGNNGTGTSGVAWDVSLMPLRALDALGYGTTDNIISAFAYAASKGADVVNASLGGGSYSQAMADAISASPGTLFVVAAGNAGSNNEGTPTYPCSYPASNLLCVAATDNRDALASFSNYGPISVDLGAPGVGILSAVPPTVTRFSDNFDDSALDGWSTGGTRAWGIESDAFGPFASDSPGTNYASSTDSWLRQAAPMNLANLNGCKVAFALKLQTELGYDPFTVEASTDGSTWSELAGWWGDSGGWVYLETSLQQYDGAAAVYLRFRLRSDDSANYDGVGIDDVQVRCTGGGYSGSEYRYLDGTSMATPYVSGAAAVLFGASSANTSAVRSALISGTDPLAALAGRTVSGGRLNLKKALDIVAPAQKTVAFSSATYAVAENAGAATVTVRRSGPSTGSAQVHYATSPGTATPGADYTTTTGTLSFGAGETSKSFTVPIADDTHAEGPETVQLALSDPVGATLGTPGTATLTITDDDSSPQVRFGSATYSVNEDTGTATVNVQRTGDPSDPVSVHYATGAGTATEGSDYTAASGTLSFAAGDNAESFTVPVFDDGLAEAGETIQLVLSAPSGATLGAPAASALTILASDQQPDGLISTASTTGFTGDNVYNTTGTDQTKTATVRRRRSKNFYVRVYNDGNVRNTFTLKGTAAVTRTAVAYFDGTKNVTSSMSGSGYAVTLDPGAFRLVRVRFTVARRARVGSTQSAWVASRWSGDGVRQDVVAAVVTVRR